MPAGVGLREDWSNLRQLDHLESTNSSILKRSANDTSTTTTYLASQFSYSFCSLCAEWLSTK